MVAIFTIIITCCFKIDTIVGKNKKVDIYDVVKEAFITDKGYYDELSNHMLEKVFVSTNIYNNFNPSTLNNNECKEPFKIDLNLKEDSQEVNEDIVYVKMTYSVNILDSEDKIVGGSRDVHIAFTVKKTGDDWCIIDKDELI